MSPAELLLLNCYSGEDFREALGQQRSDQSILKEISSHCSLDGQILKLKFKYFSHIMKRWDSLDKILMLEKIEGKRKREQQVDSVMETTSKKLDRYQEKVEERRACCAIVHGVLKNGSQLNEQLQSRGWQTDHQPGFIGVLSSQVLLK